jgi:ribose 5-phosphate isomerase B
MDLKNKIIPIASDHGGFDMKSFVIEYLEKGGYCLKDFGTYSNDSVDYPDFIHPLAREINSGTYPLGIIICGSGNGAQMVANKYPGVRAALCWNEEITRLAREHNDANILAMPGRFIPNELAAKMAEIFLTTEFSGGRHAQRVAKIANRQNH